MPLAEPTPARTYIWRCLAVFDDQRNNLLGALDESHDAYYKATLFSGPSVHFHLRSLAAARAGDFDEFAEYAYAMLASWGMHRMGPGGSKMNEFENFRSSLLNVWPAATSLRPKTPDKLTPGDWNALKSIFCGIRCMASRTSLVGNSKVMAHMLPNLIPPVDRQYTLTFLFGNTYISNGIEKEWTRLELMLKEFFYRVLRSQPFREKVKTWLSDPAGQKWDTSELKIIDNLLIGFQKLRRAQPAVAP
jgi:hypothetical protein